MATRTVTATIMRTIAMIDAAALHRLLAWTSPGFPTGAFSYSSGLEYAVEAGDVASVDDVVAFAGASMARGGIWIDAVLFAEAWRADDPVRVAATGAAWRATSEAALESRQQGRAFLNTVRAAAPHPRLEAFAARLGSDPLPHCVAVAAACAAHDVPLAPALNAWLHGVAANLVSAAIRLGVTGQTGGQRALTRLATIAGEVAEAAMAADIDTIGTAAIGLDLAAMAHETQHTRLFRS